MVIPSLIKDFYQEAEAWALENIRACQESIALMAEVREAYPDDWQIEELTRSIMFDEAQMIQSLRVEVESARRTRKGLKKL